MLSFQEAAERPYTRTEIQELINEKMFLHVIGFIWYKGRFQLRGYKTAFSRRYDAKQERLILSGDEETEFAD
jgi:hypothetical protein